MPRKSQTRSSPLDQTWSWLTAPVRAVSRPMRQPAGSRKRSTAYCKRSTAYCKRSTAYCKRASSYTSRKAGGKNKTQTGLLCICGSGCPLRHPHEGPCRAETACVCGLTRARAGSRRTNSRKTAQAYSTASRSRHPSVRPGLVCLCGSGCPLRHPHAGECLSEMACVCAVPKRKSVPKAGSARRRSAVAYLEATPKARWTEKLHIKRGTLSRHGYHSDLAETERHQALRRAVAEYGPTVVMRKLTLIANLQKNKSPALAAHMKADAHWVKAEFGTTAQPKTRPTKASAKVHVDTLF